MAFVSNCRSSGWSLLALILSWGLCACEPKAEPQGTAPAPKAASPAEKSNDPHGGKFAARPQQNKAQGVADPSGPPVDLIWTPPANFKEMPARAMRKATYQVDGEAGPAEVTVFYFGPGQGGGVEENIKRWVGQFKDLPEGAAKRDKTEVIGFPVFTVRVEKGTYASGMPGGPSEPMKDWGMHAAVVETPSGAYFFKMTGPSGTVTENAEGFSSLLTSIRKKS
jgi:hypothetical protein